jgi:thioredoxin-like negative regulator of GroEL
MKRRTAKTLQATLFVLAVLALWMASAQARSERTVLGEVIKAARLVQSAQYPEAKVIIDGLQAKSPDSHEVKWLQATWAFHQGNYADTVALLSGVPNDAVDGEVAELRKLAASTLAVTQTFIEKTSSKGHFLIRYAPGDDDVIVELAGDALELAYEQIGDDLGLRPTDVTRVELLGSPKDLAQLSPLTESEIETTGTIALSKYNKLMVVSPRATIFGYPWLDTLVHEYTHLIVTRISRDTVPVWMQEGLARFEQHRWRNPPGVTMSANEQNLLSSALRKGRLITFDEMHPSMAKLPSQEAAALAYAEVYALIGWMHSSVGYAGLRDMLTRQATGESTKHAVTSVLGISWPQVEIGWKNHLRALDATAKPVSKNRPGRSIRFNKGGTSSDNVGLDQVSKAAQRYARLAGMLRASGKLGGAAVEYEKALAADPNDGFIAGKLARTLVELGNFDRATVVAEPLLQKDQEDAVAAVTMGVARSAQKNYAEAAKAFELALRISPFDPATRCGLATAYQQLSDPRATRELSACSILRN